MLLYLGPVLNAKRAFSYRGAVMWNDLEHELKDEINLNFFKCALTLSCSGMCTSITKQTDKVCGNCLRMNE